MSSPVGHALAGLIGFTLAKRLYPTRNFAWPTALLCIVLAGLPDLDFVPILLLDLPRATTHRTLSHSLLFAIIAGLVVAWAYQRFAKKPLPHFYWLFPAILLSHSLMDMSCPDYLPPQGVQWLWPFFSQFIYAPMPFMASIGTFSLPAEPLWLAFLKAGAVELVVMGSLYCVVLLFFKKR